MDIDRAGEGGSAGILEPPVVRLPAIWRGNKDDVAAAGVIHAIFGDVFGRQNFGDTGTLRKQSRNAFDRFWVGVLHENVRELVIDECPSLAGGEVEVLSVFLLANF